MTLRRSAARHPPSALLPREAPQRLRGLRGRARWRQHLGRTTEMCAHPQRAAAVLARACARRARVGTVRAAPVVVHAVDARRAAEAAEDDDADDGNLLGQLKLVHPRALVPFCGGAVAWPSRTQPPWTRRRWRRRRGWGGRRGRRRGWWAGRWRRGREQQHGVEGGRAYKEHSRPEKDVRELGDAEPLDGLVHAGCRARIRAQGDLDAHAHAAFDAREMHARPQPGMLCGILSSAARARLQEQPRRQRYGC